MDHDLAGAEAGAAPLARYHGLLRDLEDGHRRRRLIGRAGADFSSNDYLGLAASPRLRDAVAAALGRGTPVGAGGSRLLRGNTPEHEALEAAASKFFRAEAALFFGCGYTANVAIFSTLPQRGDLVILDALVHASAREGARAGRAEVVEVPHGDAVATEDAIRAYRGRGGRGRPWIAVESLYSMDGDFAPLDALAAIADRHGAFLLVDEAHATGVYGPEGRGLAAGVEGRETVLALHTCGKALGGAGALVTGPAVLVDFLVNRCRPFIFSTAPSPLLAVAAHAALEILQAEPERRDRLQYLAAYANQTLAARCGVPPSASQIIPLVIGDNARTMAAAAALQAQGFDVRGIRPPTVPAGTARLRVSVTLNVREADIAALADAVAVALA